MRLRVTALIVALMATPLVAIAGMPSAWYLTGKDPGSYSMQLDTDVHHGGRSSARFFSIATPKGFGTILQSFSAASHRGKRVRVSAFVKTNELKDTGGVWMRVDGLEGKSLAFDNMMNRPIRGTTDWTKYDVVLDVDPQAAEIFFGVLMSGEGTMWIDDMKFEEVPLTVPTTAITAVRMAPENLDFER